FESGAGYAGIPLLDGASLHIDCAAPHSSRDPAGTLTASGGSGGAGIGRDGCGSRDRTSSIEIRGGVITASGNGGGAGIGAGRRSAMGSIVISGGTVTASGGKGGGAGIGGALHAPVGDISIRGGVIIATAAEHAAAIGAGVQGESGNIEITGHARIKKAAGGDPGADIGACLFGGCGDVRIDSSANTGCARLRRSSGVPLRLGDDTVTLPQFRLSVPSLKLDRLSVLTREYAQHAISTIDTDRRWVSQIQDVYSSLYTQVEQNHLLNSRQYVKVADGRLRDLAAAGKLLRNVSQSLPQQSAPVYTRQSTKDLQRLFQ
ncbi:MAG: hypothetical protein K2O18_19150, partial [Oscillospiraceae bacterium]|nr:hypothetical protein [Oscillospiraceae bacterium]